MAITPYKNQITNKGEKEVKIEIEKGSFHHSLKKYKLTKEQVCTDFKGWLHINENYTFHLISERTDELGFTHLNYQQQYKRIPIDGCMVMVHIKNEEATSINGQIADLENIAIQNSLSTDKALAIAKDYTGAKELLNDYPIDLLITKIETENGVIFKLAYRVRIDALKPFLMCFVNIDAATGEVINKISLVTDVDAQGTASTLYSGTQNINNR